MWQEPISAGPVADRCCQLSWMRSVRSRCWSGTGGTEGPTLEFWRIRVPLRNPTPPPAEKGTLTRCSPPGIEPTHGRMARAMHTDRAQRVRRYALSYLCAPRPRYHWQRLSI